MPTSNDNTLNMAVIGVGMMGGNHARVYAELPDINLVGVADANFNLAQAITHKYGGQPYQDYRHLLAEQKIDAVTIAVPTVNHIEVALAVIEHSIHLLIEKPIAFTLEEAEQIIDAAQEAGVKLMIGHIERFNPAIIALKKRLAQGELGRVFQIDARRQGPFPARIQDVGVVVDLAVHDVDVMRYVTNAEVSRVYAETENRIHSTHEDLLTGLLRLNDGTVGTLSINWLTPTKIRELCVIGERGMFRADYLTQDLYFFENATATEGGWETLKVLRGVSEGNMMRYAISKREPLQVELEAFIAAIENKIPVPVSGQDGLRALALAKALVQSGQTQQMVEVA